MIELRNLQQVIRQVKLGKTCIYQLIKEQRFPRPVKVGKRSLWRSDHVDAWIREQGGDQ